MALERGHDAEHDMVVPMAGHDLHTDRPGVRRRVGFVGHAGGLYGDLTVRENLRFWARTVGADLADASA